MQSELEKKLKGMLRLREGSSDVLRNREGVILEFKKTFGFGSLASYARAMASFANNKGGFLVFGVEPRPHRLVGVNAPVFGDIDPAKLTSFLNDHVSPELEWRMDITEIYQTSLGFIYTYPNSRKPVIATKNSGKHLKEGRIYYRYRGQTSAIRYPELRDIVDERIKQEQGAWMDLIRSVGESGVRHVAVIDTLRGVVTGGGAPYLIDEKLLSQMRVVKEGSFKETGGVPALKLVGELKTAREVSTQRLVPTGIHFEEIVTTFLAQRPLPSEDSLSYLKELLYQTSYILPLFFFISRARLTRQEAIKILEDVPTTMLHNRKKLISRIRGSLAIRQEGSAEGARRRIRASDSASFLSLLDTSQTQTQRRGLILAALRQNADLLAGIVDSKHLPRFLEAITHLNASQLVAPNRDRVMDLLLAAYTSSFHQMNSSEKGKFRKAVAYLDQVLFEPSVE